MMGFYLHVHLPGDKRCFWLHTSPSTIPEYVVGHLHTNALYAEAFEPKHVEIIRQYALVAWPDCTCEPIECSSSKLIPRNMRRLMNLV